MIAVNEEEFRVLFDTCFDPIRRYLFYRSGNTDLATDLAQETFMKIWEKQAKIDPDQDVGLLYRIAGDLFVSHIRREKITSRVLKEIRMVLNHDNPDSAIVYSETLEKYHRALAKLNEKQRIVFLMNRMDELTYREIAGRLSISVKAVEKRMKGALDILRKELLS